MLGLLLHPPFLSLSLSNYFATLLFSFVLDPFYFPALLLLLSLSLFLLFFFSLSLFYFLSLSLSLSCFCLFSLSFSFFLFSLLFLLVILSLFFHFLFLYFSLSFFLSSCSFCFFSFFLCVSSFCLALFLSHSFCFFSCFLAFSFSYSSFLGLVFHGCLALVGQGFVFLLRVGREGQLVTSTPLLTGSWPASVSPPSLVAPLWWGVGSAFALVLVGRIRFPPPGWR